MAKISNEISSETFFFFFLVGWGWTLGGEGGHPIFKQPRYLFHKLNGFMLISGGVGSRKNSFSSDIDSDDPISHTEKVTLFHLPRQLRLPWHVRNSDLI